MGKWMVPMVLAVVLLAGCGGRETPRTLIAPSTESRETALPLTLAEGGLVVEEIFQYSGEYWENGTPETVENVAAILVSNPGRRMIEYAAIRLECGSKQLHFFLYDLPPGEKCLVMEKEGKPLLGTVTEATFLGIRWCVYDLAPEQVRWVGRNETILVGNATGRDMEEICLRYKRYDEERGCFLGGVSFSIRTELAAGQEERLSPLYYYAGCCQVVSIETGK